jgi:hypothetical protein
LRLVEAIGLTSGDSIKQLTAFDYAGSELRQVVLASDDYAIPARRRGDREIEERPPSGGLSGETDGRVLRPYVGFVAALAIGVLLNCDSPSSFSMLSIMFCSGLVNPPVIRDGKAPKAAR